MALWDSQQMFKMRLGIANVKVYEYVIEKSLLIDYQWVLGMFHFPEYLRSTAKY